MRKPHKGLDSRRLTSLSLAPLAPDYLAMECLRHRHEDPEVRKKYIYGSLNRYIIYKSSMSPGSSTPCSSLDPCKPLTCSKSAQSSFLIQHTLGQSLHPRQSHKPAPSKSPGASSCLLCGLEVWAFSLPGFHFAAGLLSSLQCFPRAPAAAWLMCASFIVLLPLACPRPLASQPATLEG